MLRLFEPSTSAQLVAVFTSPSYTNSNSLKRRKTNIPKQPSQSPSIQSPAKSQKALSFADKVSAQQNVSINKNTYIIIYIDRHYGI